MVIPTNMAMLVPPIIIGNVPRLKRTPATMVAVITRWRWHRVCIWSWLPRRAPVKSWTKRIGVISRVSSSLTWSMCNQVSVVVSFMPRMSIDLARILRNNTPRWQPLMRMPSPEKTSPILTIVKWNGKLLVTLYIVRKQLLTTATISVVDIVVPMPYPPTMGISRVRFMSMTSISRLIRVCRMLSARRWIFHWLLPQLRMVRWSCSMWCPIAMLTIHHLITRWGTIRRLSSTMSLTIRTILSAIGIGICWVSRRGNCLWRRRMWRLPTVR